MPNELLPCGCCRSGCMCEQHTSVRDFRGRRLAITCDHHKIKNDLDDAMRRVFSKACCDE